MPYVIARRELRQDKKSKLVSLNFLGRVIGQNIGHKWFYGAIHPSPGASVRPPPYLRKKTHEV